jgi:hypothetical protein
MVVGMPGDPDEVQSGFQPLVKVIIYVEIHPEDMFAFTVGK